MVFRDRAEAGRMLAERLSVPDPDNTVVIALPRGGLPVAAEIADRYGLPLDVALVRKVGVPHQPELALAAVSDGAEMTLVVNEDVAQTLRIGRPEVEALARRELPELARRRKLYCGDRPALSLRGKTVIVVDDGVATGATARLALRIIRNSGAREIVLALPVAPPDSLEELEREADRVVCLETPRHFMSVGSYYRDFHQVRDDEAVRILDDARHRRDAHPSPGEGK